MIMCPRTVSGRHHWTGGEILPAHTDALGGSPIATSREPVLIPE